RVVQGRDRSVDAVPLAPSRLLPDALGGTGRLQPERGDRRGGGVVRAGLLPFLERPLLAWRPFGFHLHGARHRGREARALHRRIVEVGQRVRPRHRPRAPTLLVVGVGAWPRRLWPPTLRTLCDHGLVGDHRRLCRATVDRRRVHAPLRADAHPRLASDRQQVPADHRAAQPEHGYPGDRAPARAPRRGPGRGGMVDDRQPVLPRCPLRPGDRAGGARQADRLLAVVSRWTAFLLAGSRPSGDPLARSMMLGHKALIPIAGEPMVLRPLRALLASPEVGKIIVLTQDPADLRPVLPDEERIAIRGSSGTIAQTIAEQLADHAAEFPVLVATADHALLDPAMVAEFTAKADGADLAVARVESKPLLARFPHAKRTWIGFKGGRYSGANLFSFSSPKVLPAVGRWGAVEQDRKKGWRLLSSLGPAFLRGA